MVSGTYYFRMVALNGSGSTWSNELTITVQIPPGSFLLNTNTTLPDTNESFWVNWSISNGVDNYSLYWSTSPGVDTGDNLYVEGLANDTLLIKGMVSGTYYFRMVALNGSGSTWSNELTITVQIPPTNGGDDDDDDDTPRPIHGYNMFFLIGFIGLFVIFFTKKHSK